MKWHILDVVSIWLKEFAAALAREEDVLAWQPVMRSFGACETWTKTVESLNPPLAVETFPLQRGYARFPLSMLLASEKRIKRMLCAARPQVSNEDQILVCTTPYWAPVAERWTGPVVYYQTDLTVEYAGVDRALVQTMDRRLCRRAEVVCPNSARIADYFVASAGCDPAKIQVVPNATREENLYAKPPVGPGPLPADVAGLSRPLAGVIGNLAANMDWEFLQDVVAMTPDWTWLFVGPATMDIPDRIQREARRSLLEHGGRIHFIGSRPYGELQSYARAFDAALLPYLKKEPTYSGSSTRFYEHLAACRPMIATRGFAELLTKEPLLELVASATEAAEALERLRRNGFADGQERERWLASFDGTWETRARTVVQAVRERCPGLAGAQFAAGVRLPSRDQMHSWAADSRAWSETR